MKVSEIFLSIQGEGVNIGKPVVFLRLAGCNLKCEWCDSKFAWQGKEMDIGEVINQIREFNCKNVVITGGEPSLQIKEIEKLINIASFNYEIETNGTKLLPNTFNLITVSPKKEFIDIEILERYIMRGDAYFKFVVENEDNCAFWIDLINKLNIPADKVIMMPEGVNDKKIKKIADWLVEICKMNGYRFSPRLQIWLYGKRRGV
jgi:organic radical activating enzyme